MSLFLKYVPEGDRTALKRRLDAEHCVALIDLGIAAARLADAGQVALDVGHEHRHAALAETLGDALQRYGLTRACRTRNNAVAIRHIGQQQKLRGIFLCYKNRF